MGNSLAVSQKVKHSITIWPSDSTPTYIPKRMERRDSVTCTNVHKSIIHKSQKMEAIQLFINRWMNKQNVVYTYHGVSFNHKNNFYNMDEPWKHYAKWNKPDTEEILHDSTYIKYLE